jgi:glycosyltransferase involved in cell wall biosynthesis
VVQRTFGELSGISHLIAPSQFAAEKLKPFLPDYIPLDVIPNPIAAEKSDLTDVARNDQFVFAGRLQRDKGPLIFARAARKAHLRAVFAGSGEQAADVRREYPDAELTGWLTGPQLRRLVRSARAVVSPSLIYETQGLTPLEAAAEGVPAVVSDAGAAREAVVDQTTGLWFRSGDIEDLTTKLTTLAHDAELARELGTAAYHRFWSGTWDLSTHLDRLETVYRAVVSSASAPV